MKDPEALVKDIWSWLPTFRALAETEHMPSAAERLHITTSAISRTLGLLEDRVGQPLFNRVGRRLVLNSAGERLLRSTQDAMREVELTLEETLSDPLRGTLKVSAIGVLSNQIVVPAMLALKRAHPGLFGVLENHRTVDANELLVRGQLDVAFYYEAVEHPGVTVDRLGTTTASVYCGRGHELFEAENVQRADVLEHEFSVPMVGDSGQAMDGWPTDVKREIGMQITLLRSNLQVCLSGQMLTVLPDVTAAPHWKNGELRRLPFEEVSDIAVYAGRPRSGRRRDSSGALMDEVRQVVSELAERLAPLRRS